MVREISVFYRKTLTHLTSANLETQTEKHREFLIKTFRDFGLISVNIICTFIVALFPEFLFASRDSYFLLLLLLFEQRICHMKRWRPIVYVYIVRYFAAMAYSHVSVAVFPIYRC